MSYEDEGEIEIASADNANIPVGITLLRTSKKDADAHCPEGEWTLLADCYQPRRNAVQNFAFNASSMDREALANVVREKWIPLYRSALARVEILANAKNDEDDSLNYWTPLSGVETYGIISLFYARDIDCLFVSIDGLGMKMKAAMG